MTFFLRIFSVLIVSFAGVLQAQGFNVLFLFSGHSDLPWQKQISAGVEQQLALYADKKGYQANVYSEHLDLYRKPAVPGDQRLLKIQQKYADIEFDFILTEATLAAQLVLDTPGFYPKLSTYAKPEIINFNDQGVGRGNNVTSNLQLQNLTKIIQQLKPDFKRLVIIGNFSPRVNQKLLQLVAQQMNHKAEVWDDFSFEELMQRAASLGPDDVIIYSLVARDNTGKGFIPKQVLKDLVKSSAAPVFVYYDVLMGSGAVGGYLLSGHKVGRRLVDIVYTPTLNFSQQGFSYCGFDSAALDKYKIDRDRLPNGSFIDREPQHGFWAQLIYDLFNKAQNESQLDRICMANSLTD